MNVLEWLRSVGLFACVVGVAACGTTPATPDAGAMDAVVDVSMAPDASTDSPTVVPDSDATPIDVPVVPDVPSTSDVPAMPDVPIARDVPIIGTHFAPTAVNWPVPVLNEPPPTSSHIGYVFPANAAGSLVWDLFDIDGDGRADLVQTADDTRTGGAFVWGALTSAPYWRVYLNSGSGFAQAPMNWPVPVLNETAAPMQRTGFSTTSANNTNRIWYTFDIDGDHRPDLVQTADDTRTGGGYVWGIIAGSPHWKVFLNTGAGFATTAIDWAVPARNEGGPVATHFGHSQASASSQQFIWYTFDVDGDHRPDFVVTADDTRTGNGFVWGEGTPAPYWKLYHNTGTGFAAETMWSVPVRNETGPVGSRFGFSTASANQAQWTWFTMDIDGNGIVDLVQTADDTQTTAQVEWGAATSSPFWKVYLGSATGFARTMTHWATPVRNETGAASTHTGFFSTTANAANAIWSTLDINGDGRPELVQTADDTRAGRGYVWGILMSMPSWHVFPNTGTAFGTTAAVWSVPPRNELGTIDTQFGFSQVATVASQWVWSTMDLDGDGRPDFVQTADDGRVDGSHVWGATTTAPYWRFFRNLP